MIWPPDFVGELARRMELEKRIASDPVMLAGAKALYASSLPAFVADCVWVYEPRNASKGDPVRVPVVIFERQRAFLEWLVERFESKTSAPVEKSRDSGATWMACAFAVWLYLFHPGSIVGFGSRKEILVDRNGDMSSIFEKIRAIIRQLPHYLKPAGFSEGAHFNYMRLLNPENEAAIIGEAGDNIGRGGRTSVYIIDESAYLERPALVEASLSATTDVRIDISTPAAGSVFSTWTAASKTKFVFDVHDVPWHTPEWLKAKEEDMKSKGLGHLYRQEFLRDETAGIAGQLISSEWVESAVNACAKLGITPSGIKAAALDVADGGQDRNALSIRHGVEVQRVETRADLLADAAGSWAYAEAATAGCGRLLYDSIGVGAGAAAALRDKKGIKQIAGWSAAGEVVNKTTRYSTSDRTNEDMFLNAKSQAWWLLRDRFIATHKAVTTGRVENPDEIISLSPEIAELRELKSELSQVTYSHNSNGKVVINKAPENKPSPNRADTVMINFAPIPAGPTVLGSF